MPVAEKSKRRTADKTLADHVCEYMHDHHRALSIDTLLTRPLDTFRMGLNVAARRQSIPLSEVKAIAKLLDQLATHTNAMEAVDDVCREALNSRKRGDLKRDRY
jgi:hypothetical protein